MEHKSRAHGCSQNRLAELFWTDAAQILLSLQQVEGVLLTLLLVLHSVSESSVCFVGLFTHSIKIYSIVYSKAWIQNCIYF